MYGKCDHVREHGSVLLLSFKAFSSEGESHIKSGTHFFCCNLPCLAMDSFSPLAILSSPNETDLHHEYMADISVSPTKSAETAETSEISSSNDMLVNPPTSKFEPVRRIPALSPRFPPKRYYARFWRTLMIKLLERRLEAMEF